MNEPIKMLASPELIAAMSTRDAEGNRLSVEIGEPDADGFYTPRFTVHYDDNLVERARQEIAVDDLLLAERDRLLDAIPECAAHGNRCVPNAIEWVLASIELEKAAEALLEWFTKGVDCLPPGDLRQNLRAARQGGPTWEEEHTALAAREKRA